MNARLVRLGLPLLLAASTVAAEPLHPNKFGISDSRKGRLFLSGEKATPGFDRIEPKALLFSPDGGIGPARTVPVVTMDGREGFVDGRSLGAFDRHGLYFVDLSTRSIRNVPAIPGDVDIACANPRTAFLLERKTGRLHRFDLADARLTELFPGAGPGTVDNRITAASPDGRFVVFNTSGPDAGPPITRLFDAVKRDCVTIRELDEPPFAFGPDRVVYGPDPYDGKVCPFQPDALVSELKALCAGPPKPAPLRMREAALDAAGTRLFTIDADGNLAVSNPLSGKAYFDARGVGYAAFLPDDRMLIRRADGFHLVGPGGLTLGGPWFGMSLRDLPVLSPKGGYAMFVSYVAGRPRFRTAIELGTGRVVAAIDDSGETAILMDPRFTADDGAILADGYRLDLVSGIATRTGWLDRFDPARLSPVAPFYLHYADDGRLDVLDTNTGRPVERFPFPDRFTTRFTGDPCLFFLLPDYPARLAARHDATPPDDGTVRNFLMKPHTGGIEARKARRDIRPLPLRPEPPGVLPR